MTCSKYKLVLGLTFIELICVLLAMSGFFVLVTKSDNNYAGYLVWAMALLALVAYLILEITGICTKEKCLVVFDCIVRVLKTIGDVILITLFFYMESICKLGICNADVDKDYFRSVLELVLLKKSV